MLPMFEVTPSDYSEFESNPTEYLNRTLDVSSKQGNVSGVATSLLVDILKFVVPGQNMPLYLQDFMKNMVDNLEEIKHKNSGSFIPKESIMFVLGAVSEIIQSDSELT